MKLSEIEYKTTLTIDDLLTMLRLLDDVQLMARHKLQVLEGWFSANRHPLMIAFMSDLIRITIEENMVVQQEMADINKVINRYLAAAKEGGEA